MKKSVSILWLTIKIVALTLLMDAGQVAFIYQNF